MIQVERLSGTDEAFLEIEDHGLPMHVGVLLVLSGEGLVREDRSLDLAAFRARLAGAVARVPRLRQRLARVPGLGHAWIDDGLDLDAHIRHVTAPGPGGRAELMEVAGRALGPALDRAKPLWRMTAIDGLEDGRLAIALAAHHAMIDGVAGITMLEAMLSDAPAAAARDREPRATPPSAVTLAVAMAAERARTLRDAAREARERTRDRDGAVRELGSIARGLVHTARDGLVPGARTSLNPAHVSPRRGLDGARLDLVRAKAVRAALGGTVNDVVLATVAGALRRALARRGDDVDRARRFRALVPVDLRARTGEAHVLGNSVALVLAHLPVSEPDPRARYDAVRAATEHLKHASHEIESTAWIEHLGDVAVPRLIGTVFRVTAHLRAFQIVVTNVRGPSAVLQLGPARVEEVWGLVPLFARQGVGIAALSYAGGLFVSVHADLDVVPEPHAIAVDLSDAFEELAAIAGV